jgi:hypothetical protein
MGAVLRALDSHSREILRISGHYKVTRGGIPLASRRWGTLGAAARVIHLEYLETQVVLGKGIAVPHQ